MTSGTAITRNHLVSFIDQTSPETLTLIVDEASLIIKEIESISDIFVTMPIRVLENENATTLREMNSLVLIDLQDPEKVANVLVSQKNYVLESNIWVAITNTNTNLEQIQKTKRLSLQSQIYLINGNGLVTEMFGNAYDNPTFQVCFNDFL